MSKKIVFSQGAPEPVGAYSHGIIVNGLFFSAGQIGIDPKTNRLVEGSIEDEARRVFLNIGELLKAAGTDYDNLVKTTLYITDMKNFTAVDNVYREFVKNDFPGRTCVEVSGLPKGAAIEAEVVAVVE